MIRWLNFYFLGFFSDRLSKEGAERSFLNTLLSLLLTLILLCSGLLAGYTASYGAHYGNASDFREFYYSFFANENSENRIDLNFKDGRLDASIPDGRKSINAFLEEDGDYILNDYKLVLDTRPAETAFDDFKVVCKNSDGEEISYEDYRNMSASAKEKASCVLNYTGRPLDVKVKQAEYINFLNNVSVETSGDYSAETAKAFKELNDKKAAGQISETEYADTVYVLFVKAYYPDLTRYETYGGAPTLRTYYLTTGMGSEQSNYLIILDDLCICSFKTTSGFAVDFGGYYSGYSDNVISADGMSGTEIQNNLDGLLYNAFKGSASINLLVYLVNTFKLMPLFLGIMLVLAFIFFGVCKFKKIECCTRVGQSVKIIGSFLLVSSLITFILSIIYSFVMSRETVYTLTAVTLTVIIVVRTAILLIKELVKNSRAKQKENQDPPQNI